MAPHKSWKGHIQFGLLSIPIFLTAACRDKKLISFNLLHSVCKTQIKMPKFCEHCEVKVPSDQIVKGYEAPGGWIVVTDAEIESIAPESSKIIEVTDTVKQSDVDPMYLAESFYSLPEPAGHKPYSLLARALSDTKSLAIGQITKSSREHIVLFRPKGNALMAHFLWYANEVPQVAEFDDFQPAQLSTNEIGLAKQLVESLASDFKPEFFENNYEQRLVQLVQSKTPESGVRAPAPIKVRQTKTADDVMEILAASLAMKKPKRAIHAAAPAAAPAAKKGKKRGAA